MKSGRALCEFDNPNPIDPMETIPADSPRLAHLKSWLAELKAKATRLEATVISPEHDIPAARARVAAQIAETEAEIKKTK